MNEKIRNSITPVVLRVRKNTQEVLGEVPEHRKIIKTLRRSDEAHLLSVWTSFGPLLLHVQCSEEEDREVREGKENDVNASLPSALLSFFLPTFTTPPYIPLPLVSPTCVTFQTNFVTKADSDSQKRK